MKEGDSHDQREGFAAVKQMDKEDEEVGWMMRGVVRVHRKSVLRERLPRSVKYCHLIAR